MHNPDNDDLDEEMIDVLGNPPAALGSSPRPSSSSSSSGLTLVLGLIRAHGHGLGLILAHTLHFNTCKPPRENVSESQLKIERRERRELQLEE